MLIKTILEFVNWIGAAEDHTTELVHDLYREKAINEGEYRDALRALGYQEKYIDSYINQ